MSPATEAGLVTDEVADSVEASLEPLFYGYYRATLLGVLRGLWRVLNRVVRGERT